MISSVQFDICFVEKNIHQISESNFSVLSKRLVRLNNYDHVTSDLFNKLKRVQGNPNLSRFIKPTPKICLACCKYLSDVQTEEHITNDLEPTSSVEVSFEKLIQEIKTRHFTEDELNTLMLTIGERIAPLASKHVASINKRGLGNRFQDMITMTYQSNWATAFSPFKFVLLGLINGNGKRTETQETRNRRIRLATHAIETMFAVVNLNYTSVIILSEMLYMYFLSNSRRVCEIYGAATGGGSSATLQNALDKISKEPHNFPKDSYVVVAFDNNQVMAKSHRVELDCKMKVSVVTSLAAFELLDAENPQRYSMSFPLFSEISQNDASALNAKLQQFTSSSLKVVNEYLVKYIRRRLVYTWSC